MLPDRGRIVAARGGRFAELLLLGSSLLACAALLAVLELGARDAAGGSAAEGGAADDIYAGHVYSERLGWEPRAGARFQVYGAHTSINALGYRGRSLAAQRQPGRARVVMLGDSVAFGYGVDDDQTFAAALDPDQSRFEVANLAVPGYGVDQSLLRFEQVGQALVADFVVLNLCVENDLADVMLPVFLYDGRHPKPWFGWQRDRLELHDEHLRLSRRARLGLWLRQRSYLYRRLTGPAPAQAGDTGAEHWSVRRRRATSDRTAAVRLLGALIGRLREGVQSAGGQLVVAVHPNKASYRRGERWVERLLRRPELQGLQIVDVGRAYREAGLGFGYVTLDAIGHLNARGHWLAAGELRRALEQRPAVASASR
jgi:hypothetical protein